MLRHQWRGISSVLQEGSLLVKGDSMRLKERCFRFTDELCADTDTLSAPSANLGSVVFEASYQPHLIHNVT
jgi:hypothetical protein